jgi:hypothetical protein
VGAYGAQQLSQATRLVLAQWWRCGQNFGYVVGDFLFGEFPARVFDCFRVFAAVGYSDLGSGLGKSRAFECRFGHDETFRLRLPTGLDLSDPTPG